MVTASAVRAALPDRTNEFDTVATRRRLYREGWTPDAVTAQLDAGRWQRVGRAVVRHNGPITDAEIRRIALANCGPRALLTGFAAAEEHGLLSWRREAVDVLVPAGSRVRRPPGIPVRVHRTTAWPSRDERHARDLHSLAPALVLAAGTFATARPACGLLAAGVQQRLLDADRLMAALRAAPRCRHHAAMTAAVADIGMGAEALSEIDFARLCRRHGLPTPIRQAVRLDSFGRRRYFDAEWPIPVGRPLVVEVDGALHLMVRRWWDDQLRQNEITLSGRTVLRFPTVIVREEEAVVADQVRRGLRLT